MAGLMFRKRTLAIASETTYGTLETLVAGDVYKVVDPELKPEMAVQDREKNDGTLGTDTSVPDDAKMLLTFRQKIHGDGSTGDPAWAAELFPSVGMPSNTTNSYRTSSTQTDWKGLSAALNRDGKRRTARGMMGSLKITLEAGKAGMLDWNFVGGYNVKPSATAQLTTITFEEVVPPRFAGTSRITVDGSTSVSTKVSKVEIDIGTSPFARHDPNAVGGYIGGWLENIRPTFTLDPESEAVGTKDWQGFMDDGTAFTMIFVLGTTTGNICTITCTLCQINKSPEDAERNGLMIDQLAGQINGTVTIVWS